MEKKTDEGIKEILGLTDEEIEFFDYIYGREQRFILGIIALFILAVGSLSIWLLW